MQTLHRKKINFHSAFLKQGFTLIELLVVIAIIGILASVVLASLNTARQKGVDVAIKGDVSSMRNAAEINYDNAGGTYAGVCADTTVTNQINAAMAQSGIVAYEHNVGAGVVGTATCNDSITGYIIQVPLKTTGFYCVSNAGTAQVNPDETGIANATDFDCN